MYHSRPGRHENKTEIILKGKTDLFTHPFTIYGLFILLAIYMFYNLWGGSLHNWDTAWYAEIAREIVVEGKGWLTFHYNHELWFEKPPLFIWLIAAAYKIFGVNEFAVRIWSTLFGFGSVILVYILAKELFSSKKIALFSSLIFVGFHHFVRQSRMGMMDAPLTFFMLLGIYLFWVGRKKEIYLVFVGIITGIAFMIKSFAAFQIPIIIVFYVFMAGEWKKLINPKFIYGFLIGFLICLPWHIYQYSKYGNLFINEYFGYHILQRTLEPIAGSQTGLLYYFEMIIYKNIPLGAIGLLTIPYILFSIFSLKENNAKKPAFLLIIIPPIVTLTLFTFVSYKNASYMLPAYPFLSVLIATSVDLISSKVSYGNNRILAIILIILIAILTANFFLAKRHKNPDYSPEIKGISLSAKHNSSKFDQLILYKVYPVPAVLFYSERKVFHEEKDLMEYNPGDRRYFLTKGDALLKIASGRGPLICLMSKEDGLYEELKKEKYGMTILEENDLYILFKRER